MAELNTTLRGESDAVVLAVAVFPFPATRGWAAWTRSWRNSTRRFAASRTRSCWLSPRTSSLLRSLTSGGRVYAWGKDAYGKLGLGAPKGKAPAQQQAARHESTPVLIEVHQIDLGVAAPGMQDIRQLAAMSNHCLALAQDGSLWCWGSNGSGRLGAGRRVATTFADAPLRLVTRSRTRRGAGLHVPTIHGAPATLPSAGCA